MLISDVIKYAMDVTNTPAQKCAAALGFSPQNYGQRLKRDTLNLKHLETVLYECGLGYKIELYKGSTELWHYGFRPEED